MYCSDVLNFFSGHTSSAGRSGFDQGTSHNAEQEFSFQVKSMGSALGHRVTVMVMGHRIYLLTLLPINDVYVMVSNLSMWNIGPMLF